MTINRPSAEWISTAVQHHFSQTYRPIVEPVSAGVSTWVYRLYHDGEMFYLRVLPEAGASLIPEAVAHDRLASLGLRVPRVVMVEDHNAILDRSVMLTTAIPGQPLSGMARADRDIVASVLRDAGRELALLNQVPVDGFGWIRRDQPDSTDLVGEHASYRSWVESLLAEALPQLHGNALSDADVALISNAVDVVAGQRSDLTATLAHGDFDLTHIYHYAGDYAGMIDFGEIRGADRWHDLAHFRLHDAEQLPFPTRQWLINGYATITPLPDDHEFQLSLDGLVNGLVALARSQRKIGRIGTTYQWFLLQAIRRDIDVIRSIP